MLATAREVLADKGHPAWLGAWKFIVEQGYGRAALPVGLIGVPEPAAPQVARIGGIEITF